MMVNRGISVSVAALGLAVLASGCSESGVSNDPAAVTDGPIAGKEFRHSLSVSRFRIGQVVTQVGEAGVARTVGTFGVFAVEQANGAVLAVPSSPGIPKRNAASIPSVKALTTDASIHNARVFEYFRAAGLPTSEVGGMHVTTTMEGSAPIRQRTILPSDSHFVAYTTHLERQIDGIPVTDSQAWASFNANDEVTSEGVFWPAIPAEVVAQAQTLRKLTADAARHNALRSSIQKTMPELGDTAGRVVIAHTPPSYRGPITTVAVYEVTPRGIGAYVHRFDETGSPVVLAGDAPSGQVDSPKTIAP